MSSITYNSNLLFVGPSPSDSIHIGELHNLRMIQQASIQMTNKTMSVQGIGERSSIHLQNFGVNVECSFSFLTSDGFNESALGLCVNNITDEEQRSMSSTLMPTRSSLSNQDSQYDNRNLFFASIDTNDDLNALSNEDIDGNLTLVGVGNCYIKSYSVQFSLDNPITSSVTFSGETFEVSNYVHPTYSVEGVPVDGVKVPATSRIDGSKSEEFLHIDSDIYIIPRDGYYDPILEKEDTVTGVTSPRNLEVLITGDSIGQFKGINTHNTKNLQSASINLGFERFEKKSIKSQYSTDKPVVLPCKGTLAISLIVDEFEFGDSRDFDLGLLDFVFTLNGRDFDNGGMEKDYLEISVKKAKLVRQGFSQAIGGRMVWQASFSFEDGAGSGIPSEHSSPISTDDGIYMKSLSPFDDDGVMIMGGHSTDPVLKSENFWISNQFKTSIELD